MLDFDVRALRYFIAAAQGTTVSSAARQLRVSQPSVSKQLARLQRIAGIPLFRREDSRLRLTDAGDVLYEHARRIVGQVDAIKDSLDSTTPARTHLRVAIPCSLGGSVCAPAIADLLSGNTGLTAHLEIGTTTDALASVLDGQFDIVLTYKKPTSAMLTGQVLGDVETNVWLPHHWKQAAEGRGRSRGLSLADLADMPLIAPPRGHEERQRIEAMFYAFNLSPNVRIECPIDTTLVGALIERGAGYAFLPRRMAQSAGVPHRNVRMHQLAGEERRWRLYAAFRSMDTVPKAVKQAIAALNAALRQSLVTESPKK